jgi:H+/Cl- antiporter ClcA
MGRSFDIFIYISIAIIYNLFVHNLASITYEELQYDEKHDNTIIMLVIFGIAGIIVSRCINKNKKYNNKYAKNGLHYGGILLSLTALLSNWSDIGSEIRVLGFSVVFGLLIWYSYRIENNI